MLTAWLPLTACMRNCWINPFTFVVVARKRICSSAVWILGSANALTTKMMAITTMSSTSEKPAFRSLFMFFMPSVSCAPVGPRYID
jgi:hypothetical protein